MKISNIILGIGAALLLNLPLFAQTKTRNKTEYCENYHKEKCKFQREDIEFQYNSQSKSALFRPGQSCTFNITVFKGFDYRMTFHADENLLQGQHLMYKVLDARTKKVLFETSEDDTNLDFEFVCDNSLNLIIQLQLPEVSYEPTDESMYGCLGFLLESRNSLKTGF
ncbi:MAG: hypothetical protein IT240_08670 [Bacteroidia bacterium]|jgi:hypothetical protein|nr:hypothetical protein [Bacteroidia bacterium]MCC6769104.1 hypothetical protein [Bacteroidia bacterium]